MPALSGPGRGCRCVDTRQVHEADANAVLDQPAHPEVTPRNCVKPTDRITQTPGDGNEEVGHRA